MCMIYSSLVVQSLTDQSGHRSFKLSVAKGLKKLGVERCLGGVKLWWDGWVHDG